jgi:hydrogenase expression/formation protein HypE
VDIFRDKLDVCLLKKNQQGIIPHNWKTIMESKPYCIKGVLFDFDATLTKPHSLDFDKIKMAMGCPENQTVLEFIENLDNKDQQRQALKILDDYETEAAGSSTPNIGAEALVGYLQANGVPMGIITRNSHASVIRALKNFKEIKISDFMIVVSRDTPARPKPSPEGVHLACTQMDIPPDQMLVVGDFEFDIQAGRDAGAMTAYITNQNSGDPAPVKSDFTVSNLRELKPLIRMGLPLSAGKLPNDLLEDLLGSFDFKDPSLLVSPGIGEDTAAVDLGKAEVLVLTSDPITFATDSIGRYAVLVNANDMATSGADPRWLLATLLLPCGITPAKVRQIVVELKEACGQLGITLCGGHTEVTDAVTRPVVTGMMAGTVSKKGLIAKGNIQAGDQVLVTKGVAVEGTAIIATEFSDRLTDLGMAADEIARCQSLIYQVSILEEARIARTISGVRAMHDITEGGLATALNEVGIAGGHKIRVHMDKIPILARTKKICNLLGIEPLGLIGSGSLLICCSPEETDELMSRIKDAGIEVACIAEVLGKGRGIEAVHCEQAADWPVFEVDEIARLFG